jgi:hypothetical protein
MKRVVLLFWLDIVVSFSPSEQHQQRATTTTAFGQRSVLFLSQLPSGRNNEVDEDDEGTTAYGNRSLAWTNRYRRLIPYEWARQEAMKLGLRSREEWDDYLQDGRVYQNKYLPSRPDEMYADDWESWDEFLGIMRGYEDARYVVQKVLQIKSMEEYQAFVAADAKRAEGLRIPYKPEIVYKDKGWISSSHFFTVEGDSEGKSVQRSNNSTVLMISLTTNVNFFPDTRYRGL